MGLPALTRSLDSLLEAARSSIARLSPEEAQAAVQDGAMLVDTRSPDERRQQGVVIPGALQHPLSVVLWRLDDVPREQRVILICRYGFSSSLAAAELRRLGFREPGDVIGGVDAWQAAGLPVEPVR